MGGRSLAWAASLSVLAAVVALAPVPAARAQVLPAGLLERSWPQFRDSARHTGFNPYEHVLGPLNVGSLTELWASPGVLSAVDAVVVRGRVYFYDGADLIALNGASGRPIWSVPGDWSSPAYADGIILVTDQDSGELHAFNSTTGALLWSVSGQVEPTGGVTVANDVAYWNTNTGYVEAVSLGTRTVLWTENVGGLGQPMDFDSVAGGRVFLVTNYPRNLVALRADTGQMLWHRAVPLNHAGVTLGPAVAGGVIYVGGRTSLLAMRARNGSLVWMDQLHRGPLSEATVAYGEVFVCSQYGRVYAFHAADGSPIWSRRVGHSHAQIGPAGAVVANGVLYVATFGKFHGHLLGLGASDGSLLWNQGLGPWVAEPVVVAGRVYISDERTRGGVRVRLHAFGLTSPSS